MLTTHFYHATIRKIVSVFGTVFNNISVVRRDQTGKVINIQRVPLAYGPKQKFLARIDEQPDLNAPKVAIKLPRMSFEIVTMVYDASTKINRNNMISADNAADPMTKTTIRQFAPYRMGIELSIMAKNQDDALQIVEQILPYFQPEYTVTMKDVEGMDIRNDIPIVLTNVVMNEDYEGDFMTRRAIIYTLTFELRVRFYGPTQSTSVVKQVIADILNGETGQPIERITASVDPLTATEAQSHQILNSISFFTNTTSFNLGMSAGTGLYLDGEQVLGTTSGTNAHVISFTDGVLLVKDATGIFKVNETLVGQQSNTTRTITGITPTYDL
jgi:T4-like virus Myoviridae tail sheath stabiliser